MSPKLSSREYNYRNAARLNARQFHHPSSQPFARITTHPQHKIFKTSGLPHDPLVTQIPPQFQTSLLKIKSQVKHDYF